MTQRRRLRRWLFNLHLYGGLLCSSSLVVFGASSLVFNHRFDRLVSVGSTREWTRTTLARPDQGEPADVARSIADEVGLFGRIPPERVARDPGGGLNFTLLRPGREYSVRVGERGSVFVTEHRLRFATILLGLHELGPRHDSLLLTSWWYFSNLTIVVLMFLAVSGVAVWILSRRPGTIGWKVLIGAPAIILALIAWLAA